MKYLKVSLIGVAALAMVGCSGKTPEVKNKTVETISIDKIKITTKDNSFSKELTLNSRHCGKTSSSSIDEYDKVEAITSNIDKDLKEKIDIQTKSIKNGLAYEISYCEKSNNKLDLGMNIELYNKPITISSQNDSNETVSKKYSPEEYANTSSVVLEKDKPLNFGNFSAIWTTETYQK